MNTLQRRITAATISVVCTLAPGAAAGGAESPRSEARALSRAFAGVVEEIQPSVVSIRSMRRVQAPGRNGSVPSPDLRRFFGDDFLERFFGPRIPEGGMLQQGAGTGVIVTEKGHIVTNNHVVQDADEVTVRLPDERSLKAEVIGTDPKTDLAVIKVDAEGLQPATLGDSDALQIGEWVVAAGNPFGLSSTITAGIVSAKGRANVGIADYEDFIQTDAAINPGNSGGPLVNLDGDVVGINAAIFTRSGGYMGIGFAIPSNMVRKIMTALIEHGRVVRGWMGAVIQDLTPGLARSFGFDSTDGVLIADVEPGGPADEAGLQSGDIVLSLGGQPTHSMHKLRAMVAETAPGTEVDVTVFREGDRKTFTMQVGELETKAVQAAPEEEPPVKLGIAITDLTPEVAAQLNIDETEGVVIASVQPGSKAARAGLQRGNVILSVDNERVRSVDEFRRILREKADGPGIRLTVLAGTTKRFAYIPLDQD